MFQLLDTYRLESSSVDRGEVPGEGGETPGEGVEGSPGDLEAHARGTYRLESSSVDRGEVPGEGGETPGGVLVLLKF